MFKIYFFTQTKCPVCKQFTFDGYDCTSCGFDATDNTN